MSETHLFPERESSILELKRTIPANDQIIRTAIGFCNLYGGRLVLGVDDTRRITGVAEQEIEKQMEYLHKSIYEACSPPILPTIYSQRIGDKLLLVIEISEGMNKPYFKTSEGISGGTYVRIGRSTVRANAEMIEELKWQSRGRSYDQLPLYQSSIADLDRDSIGEFLRSKPGKTNIRVSDQVLRGYNLISKEQSRECATIGGMLLFGKEPQSFLSEAFVIASHFSGKSGRHALAAKDCAGTLFSQFEDAFSFITGRLTKSYRIVGRRRVEQLEIPEEAIREVLMNALVHRNYAINAPTKIALYDDRLEIFSPGLFPGPLNIDDLENGITYIRNVTIAKVLREAGYIEKLGTGFITLYSSYRQAGLKRPAVIEGDNFVKCILPRIRETSPSKERSLSDLFTRSSEISIKDVQEYLSISRASAGRRLSELLEQGIITRKGRGPRTRYSLSEK